MSNQVDSLREQEWLTTSEPQLLLDSLADAMGYQWRWYDRIQRWFDPGYGPRLDWEKNRKLRLWASACCRQVWYLIEAKVNRWAVTANELFADGRLSRHELENVVASALDAAEARSHPDWRGVQLGLSWRENSETLKVFLDTCIESRDAGTAAAWATVWSASSVKWAAWGSIAAQVASSGSDALSVKTTEQRKCCDLLRDIWGAPRNLVQRL